MWQIFGLPAWALDLKTTLEKLVATFQEALDGWKSYTSNLKSRNDELSKALSDAQSAAQKAADDLAAFQADDAATDAAQIADATQALADQLQAALDAAQAPVEEPPVVSEPVEPAPEG